MAERQAASGGFSVRFGAVVVTGFTYDGFADDVGDADECGASVEGADVGSVDDKAEGTTAPPWPEGFWRTKKTTSPTKAKSRIRKMHPASSSSRFCFIHGTSADARPRFDTREGHSSPSDAMGIVMLSSCPPLPKV